MRAIKSVAAFKRTLRPGTVKIYDRDESLFVFVDWDGKRLSISGVEGPRTNGDCLGSSGQCGVSAELVPAESWTPEMVAGLRSAWRRWHLNDMRAGCEHQRAAWDTGALVEVVEYGLTTEASQERRAALKECARAGLSCRPATLTARARALAELDEWFKPRFTPPDADSPLSGCYEVKKRERRNAVWVSQDEHPAGLLCRPCPECGYLYGSACLTEDVPADVLAFLAGLPASDRACPWRSF